uniref:Non-contractile tail tubular protein n=1 Tax=Yersinia phage vB_YenP_WX1 TaxID=2972471 RepID=A0AAT9S8P6_9CAUD
MRQQAWSHWDFGSNTQVLACQSINSDMYIILRNDFNTFLVRVSFTKNAIDLRGEPYRAFMDMKIRYTIPVGTYNDDTYETSIHLPTIYNANFSRGKITVLEDDGKITEFEQPEVGWSNDPWLRLSGNLEGRTVFIGFNIDFIYEFSKFLIKQTADDGSTSTEDIAFSEELLIWSDEAQFVLTASGTLTSRSVELNLTTQFDVQDRARPFGIGRNVYFASPRSSYTSIHRFYAVQDVSSVKNAEDITAHVPNYIPNGVFSICGSGTENFCSVLSQGDPSKIFMYKFLYLNEELRQQAWSHWDFGSNTQVLACQSINSDMYIILRNDFNTFLV